MIDEKKLIEKIKNAMKEDLFNGYTPDAVLHEVYRMISDTPKQGEWIPCSERLPKFNLDVEVTTNNGERFIGHYAGGCWYDSINGDYIQVKAWKEPSEPWEGEYKVKGRIVIEIEKIPKDCFSCVQVNEYGYCQWINKYIDCCSKIGERYPTCPIEPWEGENDV